MKQIENNAKELIEALKGKSNTSPFTIINRLYKLKIRYSKETGKLG